METHEHDDDGPDEQQAGLPPAFCFQLRMLEKGADLLQRHIERMDGVLFRAKASGVTVWVALMGWSFSGDRHPLILLGFVVILGFWLLGGYFRGIQARYLASSSRLTRFLNDEQAVRAAFHERRLPPRSVYPMNFDETHLEKLILYGKGLSAPSVATLYLFLVFINYLIWLVR